VLVSCILVPQNANLAAINEESENLQYHRWISYYIAHYEKNLKIDLIYKFALRLYKSIDIIRL
jgi:hypothetical protein